MTDATSPVRVVPPVTAPDLDWFARLHSLGLTVTGQQIFAHAQVRSKGHAMRMWRPHPWRAAGLVVPAAHSDSAAPGFLSWTITGAVPNREQ